MKDNIVATLCDVTPANLLFLFSCAYLNSRIVESDKATYGSVNIRTADSRATSCDVIAPNPFFFFYLFF